MAAVERSALRDCDGFRVETSVGLLGWVEETWLGNGGLPAAVALRLVDGRRGLVLLDDVRLVDPDAGEIFVRDGAGVLGLDAPRLEEVREGVVAAHWQTTGKLLEPPPPPGPLARARLALWPWRPERPRADDGERSVGATLAILLPLLALLIAAEITLAFLIAYLVTGRAT